MKNNTSKLFFLLCILLCCIVPTTCKKLEKVMMVSTGEVTSITTNIAEASGEVIDIGDGASQRGHCYAKTPNVNIDGPKTELGAPTGPGGFTSQLTNLEAGTEYYIKAYLSNGAETVYGKEISFSTLAASVPTLTTTAITSVTYTTGTSGGNISSDGGAPVTSRGVCWNIATGPTTSNNKTSDGTGTGSFTSNLSGLTPGTTYYIRAYATNSAGTAYGNELTFTTSALIPTLTTTAIASITTTTATSGGNITDDGGASVTARGVCWNTTAGPTTSNSKTSDGTGSGSFISSLTGLTAGTTYYVRAYATNSAGIAYGDELTFTTSSVVPTLTTTAITEITQTTATSGGNITNDGGASVTARGVCWNTSASPTITNNKTSDGTGAGIFSSSLTGLTANMTYYVRAYATNSAGTAYGNELTFTTSAVTIVVPTLSTTAITAITQTTATSGGNITNNGGALVTSRGVCWNTSADPTVANNKTSDGSGSGSFASSLTGLTPNTTYYVRAYATNSVETAYGNQENFMTNPVNLTDIDGNIYNVVRIGTQLWMKENLKTTHYADGTALVNGMGVGDISGDYTTKYWFIYVDNPSNKDTYGLLYTWTAAMNGTSSSDANPSKVQGVCPTGWHLPSDAEWKQLEMHLGMSQVEADRKGWRGTDEGGKLKETGTTRWVSPNTGATNESGFSGLPGGYRYSAGPFFNIGYFGYWWSSCQSILTDAFYRDLNYNLTSIYRYDASKDWGFSVRCLRD